ncbi:MAG: murein L,D-transpeptidase catalytic domain family protein [Myxococcales bacterium]|nr:murein L,D-transpeptidase catalytic domain family protein [Myxococcales bacterium]
MTWRVLVGSFSGLLALSTSACSASDDAGKGAQALPCADIVCVDSLPTTQSGTTLGASRNAFEVYGCSGAANRDLSGAEVVHRLTLPEEGFLSVAKTSGPADGFLLLLGADDAASCIDAHPTNVGAWLPPGDYFLVVDGPAGGEGEFSLRAALTTPKMLEASGVDPALAADALTIYKNAWAWGATRRAEYVVVDFRLHSAEPREWVYDLSKGELLWNLRVAHGRKSTDGVDLAHATTFSNVSGSNQSSLGLARSAGTYSGSFGPSFRMEGLEPGFNDNICSRDIVMHPWSPVGDAYVAKCGWARPSLGCPAIDDQLSLPVRDRLARPDGQPRDAGVLMLFWYPNTDWHAASPYLHGAAPTPELETQMAVECDSSQDGTPQSGGVYPCD